MSSWNFPSNQNGQIKGVADAGIENFNGSELSSLVRENCQNSLDAATNEEKPKVVVEFERYLIFTEQIPGIKEYCQVLEKCKAFWDNSQSDKAKHFLKNAVASANSKNSFVLRVSDYNTTGLAYPYSDKLGFKFDGWNALVKIDGGANKGDDKAGAFGIGKSAPFCNSHYRLVFYRTLNQAGEKAAQGISRLMSYPEVPSDSTSSMTSGVGYFGNPDGNTPVVSIPALDSLNSRTEIGTDVFVYGFNGLSNWENEIRDAVLENFLMYIYNNELYVKIQGRELNAQTLGGFMLSAHNCDPGRLKSTYGNYLALTRSEGVNTYSKNFHGMGTLELRILVDPNEKLDRKILVVRKAGMKLFRLGNLSKMVPFTGILELKGKTLNSFFRAMETVSHDNWEPGRHNNKKLAKQYYEEIKEWIRDIIVELAEHTSDDEMNVEGLSGVLQKESKAVETGNSDNKRENLNDHLGKIDVLQRPSSTTTKGFFYSKGDDGHSNTERKAGTLSKEGDSGLRVLKGKRRRKKLERHRGTPDQEGKDIVNQRKPGGSTHCILKNVRIIKQNSGIYSLNFEIPKDVASGKIELVTVGENGKSNVIRIARATASAGCNSVSLNDGVIEAINMSSTQRIKINIALVDSHDYAMEVNVYEHN